MVELDEKHVFFMAVLSVFLIKLYNDHQQKEEEKKKKLKITLKRAERKLAPQKKSSTSSVNGEKEMCHSGLQKFFDSNWDQIAPISHECPIDRVKVYECPHLDDVCQQLSEPRPNTFFRIDGLQDETSVGYLKSVRDKEYCIVDIVRKPGEPKEAAAFLKSGPRKFFCWNPTEVKAAIVTCGGLSPGLNSVIKTLVHTLYYNYSVDHIMGIRYGLAGFYTPEYLPPVELHPMNVEFISNEGGTILGSSRGGYDKDKIVDAMEKLGINQLYVVGGDGTHRAAYGISEECKARKLRVSVVGIPKTIDNDIGIVDRSFGFTTALDESSRAVRAALTEARAYPNCVGLVKVMGRSAGFLAAHTALATEAVDICLIPEIEIDIREFLSALHTALVRQGYAIVVLAEGAGQNLCETGEKDASGNIKLGSIEECLKKAIKSHFDTMKFKYNMKYIDPSYMIRSVRANAFDQNLCLSISQNAVHGAMAGYTDFSSGVVNNQNCMIPLQIIFECSPTSLDPHGRTLERLRIATHSDPVLANMRSFSSFRKGKGRASLLAVARSSFNGKMIDYSRISRLSADLSITRLAAIMQEEASMEAKE